MMDAPMEDPLIFENLPLREDLCHILVSIDPNEIKDTSVKSDFQWQLLKTRQLLFSDKNLIATPAAGMLRYIHISAKKEYYRSGTLSKVVLKNRLKEETVGALTFAVYEQCLIYNFIVKLAPEWNKAEKYFIDGKYFLMQRGALNAIELNIIITGNLLMLYASPLRLWLREVPLLDLLPSSKIEETLSKPFYIDLFTERQWVHVLPSFKRGHLVYVTNYIPKESTFVDYEQMRRHWKNTYGYRLPEDDSSMIFVGVSFFNNNDYLYPLECIRRGMHMNTNDYSSVLKFAKAVSVKAGVCGNTLKLNNLIALQNKPKIEINQRTKWCASKLSELDSDLINKWLRPSDSENHIESQEISLYTEHSHCEMDILSVNVAEEDHVVRSLEPVVSISSANPSTSTQKNDTEQEKWLRNCSQFIAELSKGIKKRSYLGACRPHFNNTDLLKLTIKPPPLDEITKSGAAYSLKAECSKSGIDQNKIQCTPYKPCFNKIVRSQKGTRDNAPKCSNKDLFTNDDPINKCNVTLENSENIVSLINSSNSSAHVPCKPVFKRKSQLYNHIEATKAFEVSEMICDGKSLKDVKSKEDQLVKSKTSLSPPVLTMQKEPMAEVELNMPELTFLLGNMKKKKLEKIIDDGTIKIKKRKKPILLPGSEIENLLLSNQLEKANVPSLCCYLKDKGVAFSKVRKEVLIEKVKQLAMETKTEVHHPT